MSDNVEHKLSEQNKLHSSSILRSTKIVKCALKWKNITYSIKISDPNSSKKLCNDKIDKYILKNISGKAMPGELVAIMGPSGSGKTTLLNVLSSRAVNTKGAVLTGSIQVNGINKSELGSKFSAISAFVQQDDVLFNMQTVTETLMTAARLRLNKNISKIEKQERVDEIIMELGLKKAKNTKIGDEKHRGVSGGERKRVNIGVEIINLPSLIFLDEPTSGLDSFQALNVMQVLKQLCRDFGVTVIASIHQPRSSIYKLFDQLILLSEGELAYSGVAGDTALRYFENIGYKIDSNFNPADFYLDLISEDTRGANLEIESKLRIEKVLGYFNENREMFENNLDKLCATYETKEYKQLLWDTVNKHSNGIVSSYCEQIAILGMRNFRQLFRDYFGIILRMFINLFFALFLSLLWANMGLSQPDIQNRTGILFFLVTNQAFSALFGTLEVFILEKGIVMRELQSNSYHLSAYYLTKFFTSLPIDCIFPIIFSCVIYWIVGLNPDPIAFIIFIGINILTSFAAIAIGFFVGSCTPTIDAANAAAPLIMVLSILFGGFYINSDSMPKAISWLENLSIMKWSFEAFVINEFSGLKFTCNFNDPNSCVLTGEQVINSLSFDKHKLGIVILILASLFIGFHIIAYSCLKCRQVKYLTPITDDNIAKPHRDGFQYYSSNIQSNTKDIELQVNNDTNNSSNDDNNGETP